MIKEYAFENRDEWLKIRSQYIGGSDASTVVGMNPYKSRYTLWAEKTGKVEGFEGNITTRVGAYLEEFVARMFMEDMGKRVHRKNRTMVNDLYPWACANIDRKVVDENAFLEIKTTNSIPLMKKLRNSDEFPDAYYAQCVHYMAVGGYDKCYLAVLVNCRELKIYEMERDEAEIKALMTAEKEFWQLVIDGTAPAVDGADSTSKTLSELYPQSIDASVSLFGFETYLDQYMALSEQITALTKSKDELGNKVKEFMKDAARGESDHYKVTFASQERRAFDTKAFAKDHGDIDLESYYKTTTCRAFKVSKKGN